MTGTNSNNLGLVYNSLQQSQQENLDLNIVLLWDNTKNVLIKYPFLSFFYLRAWRATN